MSTQPSSTPRNLITQWWSDAWTEGLWAAAWSKSINDLTPAQAAWQPPASLPGTRHSIWQLALHMIFWRESWLRRVATGQKPSKDELANFNFPTIADPSADAWQATLRRFQSTQENVAEALRSRGPEADPLHYFLPHDCYHFGQINMLRGMQGLKPIE
jgi:uncharacterized damage-inducible protein DinB